MIFLRLFFEFFKTGLFAVGGGLATLPFLYNIGAKTGWYTVQEVANMIAISESTPGPMGVNMATYVGFTSANLPGCIIAPLGLITPSIIIILLVAKILNKFKDSKLVQHIFYGLRPASTALIIAAGLGVAKIALLNLDIFESTGNIADLFNYKAILLAAMIFAVLKKKDFHPILVIVISAIIGIIFSF